MTESLVTIALGMWFGLILSGAIEKFSMDSTYNKNKALIEACEKPLPRTEHCVLVALPLDRN